MRVDLCHRECSLGSAYNTERQVTELISSFRVHELLLKKRHASYILLVTNSQARVTDNPWLYAARKRGGSTVLLITRSTISVTE